MHHARPEVQPLTSRLNALMLNCGPVALLQKYSLLTGQASGRHVQTMIGTLANSADAEPASGIALWSELRSPVRMSVFGEVLTTWGKS